MIRILIVDDDALVRSGLRLMLAGEADLEIVGEADDGAGLGAAVAEHAPDVVLLDVRMPRTDGLQALREMRDAAAQAVPSVLVLTTLGGEATLLEALRAGAAGFLLKHAAPVEIVAAIRAAAAGQPTVSSEALQKLIDHVAASGAPPQAPATDLDALSDREREVADALADGLGNAEIAARLFLSQGTVKAHISSALAKLGLENRTQLAIAAHDARRG